MSNMTIEYFIKNVCPHRLKWFCDGDHVPELKNGKDKVKIIDKKPCEFFKNNQCTHIQHPKRS